MNKFRIVKRTYPRQGVRYVVQKRVFWLFWIDATIYTDGYLSSEFITFNEAVESLPLFDNTKIKNEIVYTK